jgi:hypothetical protein
MARSERVALVVFLLASGAAAAACDSIAGIGDFHEVACEPCEDAGLDSSPGPIVDDASDASQDAGIDATVDAADAAVDTGTDASDDGNGYTPSEAGPSVDFRWARWIMPNVAITSDAATPSYSARSDGGAKDLVTGLQWGNMTTGVTSIASATTACAPPWRLPTRIELVSILDTSQTGAVLANPQFSTLQAVRYWTSSVTPAGRSWVVDFGVGTITASVSGQATFCIYVGDADGGS